MRVRFPRPHYPCKSFSVIWETQESAHASRANLGLLGDLAATTGVHGGPGRVRMNVESPGGEQLTSLALMLRDDPEKMSHARRVVFETYRRLAPVPNALVTPDGYFVTQSGRIRCWMVIDVQDSAFDRYESLENFVAPEVYGSRSCWPPRARVWTLTTTLLGLGDNDPKLRRGRNADPRLRHADLGELADDLGVELGVPAAHPAPLGWRFGSSAPSEPAPAKPAPVEPVPVATPESIPQAPPGEAVPPIAAPVPDPASPPVSARTPTPPTTPESTPAPAPTRAPAPTPSAFEEAEADAAVEEAILGPVRRPPKRPESPAPRRNVDTTTPFSRSDIEKPPPPAAAPERIWSVRLGAFLGTGCLLVTALGTLAVVALVGWSVRRAPEDTIAPPSGPPSPVVAEALDTAASHAEEEAPPVVQPRPKRVRAPKSVRVAPPTSTPAVTLTNTASHAPAPHRQLHDTPDVIIESVPPHGGPAPWDPASTPE